MRFFVTENPNEAWTLALPYIQGSFNNSKNQSTGICPNEINYGFRVRDTLSMLSQLPPDDYQKSRQILRDQAEEAIAFANAMMKTRYDESHIAKNIKVGDKVYLRLHHGYSIPGVGNKKLSYQRNGPFEVTNKISNLSFKLRLPPVMTIHPVVSIKQLEPKPEGDDPFERKLNDEPPPIVEDNDVVEAPPYEIERLMDRRTTKGKNWYLVKWKGYGMEHSVWYSIDDLQDAKDLVAKYNERFPVKPSKKSDAQQAGGEAYSSRGAGTMMLRKSDVAIGKADGEAPDEANKPGEAPRRRRGRPPEKRS